MADTDDARAEQGGGVDHDDTKDDFRMHPGTLMDIERRFRASDDKYETYLAREIQDALERAGYE